MDEVQVIKIESIENDDNAAQQFDIDMSDIQPMITAEKLPEIRLGNEAGPISNDHMVSEIYLLLIDSIVIRTH